MPIESYDSSKPFANPSSGSGTRSSEIDGTPAETKIDEQKKKEFENGSIIFPPDLSTDFYISFNSFKFSKDRPLEALRTFKFEKSVFLPFPSSLTDQYGASYTREDLYFGGEFLKDSINQLMTSDGTRSIANVLPGTGIADRVGQVAAGVLEKINEKPMESIATVAAYGLTGIGGAIGAAAKTAFQVSTNPYPVMIYQGTGFKSFAFSWVFYPESKEETETIRTIVGYFRREMLPERLETNKTILANPAVFEIVVSPDKYTKKFKRSVLTSVDVNYTPSGPAFVKSSDTDAAPAAVALSLNFQEIEIWLANDFDNSEPFDFIADVPAKE